MSHPGWLAAGVLALIWVLQWLGSRHKRWIRTRRVRRAVRAELEAERLLQRRGYRIEERQASLAWYVMCDGEEVDISLRADLIVSRKGKRFVAEVKTGEYAPRVDTAATRRQLLEYAVAYDVDGTLLVDMDAGHIIHVAFPGLTR